MRPSKFLVVAAIAAFSSCTDHHSGIGVTTKAGRTVVHSLRLTPALSGPPEFTLHWDAVIGDPAPRGFRVLSASRPWAVDTRATAVIASVDRDTRTATVAIPADDGFRYLAVQAIDDAEGSISPTLVVDTRTRLGLVWSDPQTGRKSTDLILAASGTLQTPAALPGDSFVWSPGDRSMIYVDQESAGVREFVTPDWPTDAPDPSPAGPIPDLASVVDWRAVRTSPLGDIAFLSADPPSALWVQPRSGNVTRVSQGAGIVGHFGWSPDGSALAYLQRKDTFRSELWVHDPAQASNRRVSADLGPNEYVLLATWSPDSRYLAFLTVDATRANDGRLQMHDRRLDRVTEVGAEFGHELAWGPRGDALLFLRRGSGADVRRAVLRLPVPWDDARPPGDQLQVIRTEATADLFQIRLSPDGAKLAMLVQEPGQGNVLRVFTADGQATDEPAAVRGERVQRFAFAPDSRRIAYQVSRAADQAVRVFELDARTTQSAVWIQSPRVVHFAWNPHRPQLGVLGLFNRFDVLLVDGAGAQQLYGGPPIGVATDFFWTGWPRSPDPAIFATFVVK